MAYNTDMPKRSSRPRDLNKLAASIAKIATEGEPIPPPDGKNPHAVALGRLGGVKGGKARAEKLTARKRSDIAKNAALSRWAKKGKH